MYFEIAPIEMTDTPFGVPFYYQPMPDGVESTAITLLIHTGAADDFTLNAPGIHHWLEHCPFQGTRNYPGGYSDTKGLVVNTGGSIGAYTNLHATAFWAHVPHQFWKGALGILTDLCARPLLEEKGINDEREIIFSEIAAAESSARGSARRSLANLLYTYHPFGGDVLGTKESLRNIETSQLWAAHQKGYSLSRMMVLVSGNVHLGEFKTLFEQNVSPLNRTGVLGRDRPEISAQFPGWSRDSCVIETEFPSSIVYVLFPVHKNANWARRTEVAEIFAKLYGFGGTTSPLMQELREKRKLVYSAECVSGPAGDYVGFCAETTKERIEAALEGMWSVTTSLTSSTLGQTVPKRDPEKRVMDVARGVLGKIITRGICPANANEIMVNRHLSYRPIGDMSNTEVWREKAGRILGKMSDNINFSQPKTFIFQGRK